MLASGNWGISNPDLFSDPCPVVSIGCNLILMVVNESPVKVSLAVPSGFIKSIPSSLLIPWESGIELRVTPINEPEYPPNTFPVKLPDKLLVNSVPIVAVDPVISNT